VDKECLEGGARLDLPSRTNLTVLLNFTAVMPEGDRECHHRLEAGQRGVPQYVRVEEREQLGRKVNLIPYYPREYWQRCKRRVATTFCLPAIFQHSGRGA